jgi:murein DD-endopeptidase MepM/ murein hydrolase activator NlpD
MKNGIFLNSFLIGMTMMLLSSCGFLTRKDIKEKNSEKPPVVQKEEKKVDFWKTIETGTINIKPGEVTLLNLPGEFPHDGKLICDGRKQMYTIKEKRLISFVSETYFSKLKPFDCTFEHKGQKKVIAKVNVSKKNFPSERLKVDKKRVFLSKKNLARARKEGKLRRKAYANSAERPLFFKPFDLPLNSKVTSIYGSRRIFNKKKQTQHLGTDFRAKTGTPIKSANRGRVVLSRNFFYSGNTVIIDHGLGIFTMYGHLSKRRVQEGEIIPEGTVIGLAGATGRVTGPHLHWGVTVNGMAIEGESLVIASQGLKSGI